MPNWMAAVAFGLIIIVGFRGLIYLLDAIAYWKEVMCERKAARSVGGRIASDHDDPVG